LGETQLKRNLDVICASKDKTTSIGKDITPLYMPHYETAPKSKKSLFSIMEYRSAPSVQKLKLSRNQPASQQLKLP
jgi:hypothetical protein